MSKSYAILAKQLYDIGLEPIPVTPGEKYWNKPGWENIELPIPTWPKNHGISLRTGTTIVGLDIDICDKSIVGFLLDSLEFSHIIRTGQAPKVLVPILCPEIPEKIVSDKYVDEHGEIHRIEILSKGQQFVAYHIHPDTQKPYTWNGDLLNHSLPKVSKDSILYLFDLFYDLACKRGWKNLSIQEQVAKKAVKSRRKQTSGDRPGDFYNRAVTVETVLSHYGWKHVRGEHWRRPEKERGVSGHIYKEIFCCFTTSTSLPGAVGRSPSTHDAFDLLTWFEFNGDKTRAAQELRRLEEAA